jgi:hypothetical protein
MRETEAAISDDEDKALLLAIIVHAAPTVFGVLVLPATNDQAIDRDVLGETILYIFHRYTNLFTEEMSRSSARPKAQWLT